MAPHSGNLRNQFHRFQRDFWKEGGQATKNFQIFPKGHRPVWVLLGAAVSLPRVPASLNFNKSIASH
jgi:hypothetical protein